MKEWTRTDKTYAERIASLEDGTGFNGHIVLSTGGPNATVIDDDESSEDVLTGSAVLDWFFFKDFEDRATDLKNEVFANDLDWILEEL
jgi:hypothetical protein